MRLPLLLCLVFGCFLVVFGSTSPTYFCRCICSKNITTVPVASCAECTATQCASFNLPTLKAWSNAYRPPTYLTSLAIPIREQLRLGPRELPTPDDSCSTKCFRKSLSFSTGLKNFLRVVVCLHIHRYSG